MKKSLFLVGYILLMFLSVTAQIDSINTKKNNIYLSAGMIPPVLSFSVSYDYFVINEKKIKFGPKLSLGALFQGDFDGGSNESLFFSPAANLLLGSVNSSGGYTYFEINLGYLYENLEDSGFPKIAGYLGLRFGHLKKDWFLRVGAGVPELLQASLGYNF